MQRAQHKLDELVVPVDGVLAILRVGPGQQQLEPLVRRPSTACSSARLPEECSRRSVAEESSPSVSPSSRDGSSEAGTGRGTLTAPSPPAAGGAAIGVPAGGGGGGGS
eukprot:scaffold16219_cov102-Isochrysis_galbana.AAC.17